MKTCNKRLKQAIRIISKMSDRGIRIALLAIMMGYTFLRAMLIGYSFKD